MGYPVIERGGKVEKKGLELGGIGGTGQRRPVPVGFPFLLIEQRDARRIEPVRRRAYAQILARQDRRVSRRDVKAIGIDRLRIRGRSKQQ